MSFISYIWVELRRMLHQKITWLIIIAAICTPLMGYQVYQPVYTSTRTSNYLANPAFAGALGCVCLFGLFTILQFHYIYKNQIDVFTNTIVSPIVLNIARLLALIAIAVFVQGMVLILYFPYTMVKMGIAFQASLYLAVYLIIMFPAMIFAVVFAASIYQITKRIDLSFILFFVFLLWSFSSKVTGNFLLSWIKPLLWVMSDDFSNKRGMYTVFYNRLFWISLITGIWSISLLCIRKYQKGLLGSFFHNLKKIYIPFLGIFSLIIGAILYQKQPFIDDSPLELDYEKYDTYEFNENITYSKMTAKIFPNTKNGTMWGEIGVEIKNTSGTEQKAIFEINPGYTVSNVKANGKEVSVIDRQNDDFNKKEIEILLPAEKDILLTMEYGGFPREWSIEEIHQGNTEIGANYICLSNTEFVPYTKNILPEEYVLFDAEVTIPAHLRAVVFGSSDPVCISENEDGTKTWKIEKNGEGTIFYAADFISENLEAGGIPIQFIYSAKHKEIMDEINIRQTIKNVFEYCNEHIGSLSFYGEKGMKLIELSAYMGGGYALNGASAMDENCFSEEGLKDNSKGASGSEVMAHEIIHQWWGLGNMIQEGEDLEWSSEGLTVYTTYRMMKEMFGEEYAKENYIDFWQKEADRLNNNFYHRHPEYLEKLPKSYAAAIQNEQKPILQYQVMPLKILKAEKLVGGEEAMDKILKGLFSGKLNPSYPYLTYDDFLNACGLEREDLELE